MSPMQTNPIQMMLNNLIRQNPNLQQNPMTQEMIKVIQSGDAQRGEQIANNICQSYGMSREEAIQQAQQMFLSKR